MLTNAHFTNGCGFSRETGFFIIYKDIVSHHEDAEKCLESFWEQAEKSALSGELTGVELASNDFQKMPREFERTFILKPVEVDENQLDFLDGK